MSWSDYPSQGMITVYASELTDPDAPLIGPMDGGCWPMTAEEYAAYVAAYEAAEGPRRDALYLGHVHLPLDVRQAVRRAYLLNGSRVPRDPHRARALLARHGVGSLV